MSTLKRAVLLSNAKCVIPWYVPEYYSCSLSPKIYRQLLLYTHVALFPGQCLKARRDCLCHTFANKHHTISNVNCSTSLTKPFVEVSILDKVTDASVMGHSDMCSRMLC